MRRHLKKVLGLVAILIAGAVAAGLYFGSYGDCKRDIDCGPGRTCTRWSFDSLPWWARGMSYRTCEIPCQEDTGCPPTHVCVLVDHGPGPGAHCMPRSDLPHWNERGPHQP